MINFQCNKSWNDKNMVHIRRRPVQIIRICGISSDWRSRLKYDVRTEDFLSSPVLTSRHNIFIHLAMSLAVDVIAPVECIQKRTQFSKFKILKILYQNFIFNPWYYISNIPMSKGFLGLSDTNTNRREPCLYQLPWWLPMPLVSALLVTKGTGWRVLLIPHQLRK